MLKFLGIFALLTAIAGGVFYQNNPLLFGQRTGESHDGYTIYDHYGPLDDELFSVAGSVGNDFTAYRNHCLRVLTFTNYLLPDFVKETIPNAMDLAATALAYHDVALWTDKKLNYLEPSKVRMDQALRGSSFTPQELKIMEEIILEHHKVTDFTALSEAENALINAVRKADWADASFGVIRFGLPVSLLEAAYDEINEAGFHQILLDVLVRISAGNLFQGTTEFLKIFKW
ncbi:hypothetical protein IV203_034690 [Nitzschia inconspicua]|uniref:HD domain-containing protein n=1 Tax=Nitzschia inconspicua TaxID=303405 RepID=A0A9K3PTX2_9STRA|nr:hypothetical protein IV203_034690 [Nitzschia inconspicua]